MVLGRHDETRVTEHRTVSGAGVCPECGSSAPDHRASCVRDIAHLMRLDEIRREAAARVARRNAMLPRKQRRKLQREQRKAELLAARQRQQEG